MVFRQRRSMLGEPFARNRLEAVCRALLFSGPLRLLCLAGVYLIGQELARIVAPLPCVLEADLGV